MLPAVQRYMRIGEDMRSVDALLLRESVRKDKNGRKEDEFYS